ncbi:uncharacterized protein LOC105262346 [Musca domestica]|uniref:Uncharacterized protein LOC105262346 n=1 Tax=Musca domestica TaxID=7370 RepID=A0A9J7DBU0_MUSDO|nr:uncharacterized protein LOC105262346 [Musca domestica]
MKSFMILCLLLVCCLYLAIAAPAPAENSNSVQFIKYNSEKDLEEIQRQIIAQYDHLGGTSQFHQVQSASIVDPYNIKISL